MRHSRDYFDKRRFDSFTVLDFLFTSFGQQHSFYEH